jgi:hypothetical protein
MGWVTLGMAVVGAIVALVAWFGYESIGGVVVGAVIAIIGILFKPRNGK